MNSSTAQNPVQQAIVNPIRDYLNLQYNPNNIYFDFECKVNTYVDDYLVTNVGLGAEQDQTVWCNWKNNFTFRNDGLEIVILSSDAFGPGAGRASSIPGHYAIIKSAALVDLQSTVVHEVGHLLGLLHPSHASSLNQCNPSPGPPSFYDCETNAFIIDNTACAEHDSYGMDTLGNPFPGNGITCGDYIPDTPASHPEVIKNNTTNSCTFIDQITSYFPDGCSDLRQPVSFERYLPDFTNHMSTNAYKDCRDHFTPNQVTVMRNYIANHPILVPKISTNNRICECDFDNSILIREDSDWSTIKSEYNLNGTSVSDINFFLEANLTIDQSYTFDNCTFNVADGKRINIDGTYVTIENSTLTSCATEWDGIFLNTNSLIFKNNTLDNAIVGISTSSGTSLRYVDNQVSDCGIGIETIGSLNVLSFKNNSFNNLTVGVKASLSSTIIDFTAIPNKRNVFVSCNDGFLVNDATVRISYNDFYASPRGITLNNSDFSIVRNNLIETDVVGISVGNSLGVSVRFNTLDQDNLIGPGTSISLGFSNVSVFQNTIETNARGISIYGGSNSDIDENVITLNGQYNGSTAIGCVSATGNDITDNIINSDSGSQGIYCSTGSNHNVFANVIDSKNSTSAVGIRFSSVTASVIEKNKITSTDDLDGVLLTNSSTDTIECNLILTENNTGIEIDDNSEYQEIITNILESDDDIIIRSVLGLQTHHGNQFKGNSTEAIGLNINEVDQSRFFVDSTYSFFLPGNYLPLNLFEIESAEPVNCDNPPSENTKNNVWDDELNKRYVYNKSKWENDYDRSFTKQLHLMAINTDYKKNLSAENYKDLIESYTDFSSILEAYNLLISNNSYTDIQYQKIKEIKEILNEADQLSVDSNFSEEMQEYINQLLNSYEEHKSAIESDVEAKIEALKELTDELLKGDKVSKEWSLLLSSFTNKWNKKDINEEQVNELYKIASLCLQKYGERVAIARGLLAENNFVDFSYSFDSCNDVIEQRESKIENDLQVSVFPNPTSQNITVEVNSKNTNIKVFSSTGNIVSEIDVLKKYSFEFTLNSGIYYILVTDEAGHQQIKKVVCIQ